MKTRVPPNISTNFEPPDVSIVAVQCRKGRVERIEVLYARIQRRNQESPPILLDDLRKWAEAFERPSADQTEQFDAPLLPVAANPSW